MKILITADIHNGYSKRLRDCIWSMKNMAQFARDNSIDTIIILGDLFHDRFLLDVHVYSEVYKFFEKNDDINWICFPGNHDMFLKNSWHVNSLHGLNNLITIIEDVSLIKIGDNRFWILPFIHYESVYMKVLKEIENNYEDGDVLLTHIGINGATLNECFRLKNWNIISFVDSKFDRVFTGHFHCYQQVGSNVWYPGSPIPFRFDEGVAEHGFIIYDTVDRSVEFERIMDVTKGYCPPDFITIIDDDIKSFSHADGNNVRIMLSREHTKNEIEEFRQELSNGGAKSVTIMKYKEKEIDIEEKHEESKVEDAFESWMDFDKPEDQGLNKTLLRKLEKQIKNIAKERMILDIEDD